MSLRNAFIVGTVLASATVSLFGQSRERSDRREDRSSRTRDERDSATGSGSTSSEYREHYTVLSERNFFVKDRRKATTTPASTRPAAKPPEEMFILTGVVYEPLEEKAFAYFEDVAASKLVRISVGDKLARGSVTAIDINAVAFESAGKQVAVLVGDDLTGKRSSVSASSSASGSATPATSAPAIDPNNPNLSLEERMRLRRQQEGRK